MWESTPSTERPMTFTPRSSKSGLSLATVPSSVVHTGVKSLGCEKRMAQSPCFQSWKLMVPCVVSVVKSGASSPMRDGHGVPPVGVFL